MLAVCTITFAGSQVVIVTYLIISQHLSKSLFCFCVPWSYICPRLIRYNKLTQIAWKQRIGIRMEIKTYSSCWNACSKEYTPTTSNSTSRQRQRQTNADENIPVPFWLCGGKNWLVRLWSLSFDIVVQRVCWCISNNICWTASYKEACCGELLWTEEN